MGTIVTLWVVDLNISFYEAGSELHKVGSAAEFK